MPSSVWTGILAGIGSALAVLVGLVSAVLGQERITLWMNKIQGLLSPYIQVTIPEYAAGRIERSEFYAAIEAYLYERCGTKVRKLTAEIGSRKTTKATLLFYVDDGQEIIDTYAHGDGDVGGCDGAVGGDGGGGGGGRATVWWHAYKTQVTGHVMNRRDQEERRFFRVSFHRRFRQLVINEYLPHVIEQGRKAIDKNRQRRLFTNDPDGHWRSVAFQHPASFDTLAIDSKTRKEVVHDLDAFKEGKDYYAKVGRPWKRGYLLYGPPGTGKSTMVSVMANHLKYDVYDLELTAVRNNNDLRRLFIATTGKSIIVVEDIDRSVDLTTGGGRHKRVANVQPTTKDQEEDADNFVGIIQQLTLSGLLNFIDGLWSACGGERIIVFTTNNKDMLDPVLIRPGRMDMQIEMSFCTYEGFEILANNYLEINDNYQRINENHIFDKYGEIHDLLEVAQITPAEVAEHLIGTDKDNAGARLDKLIRTLKDKDKKAEGGSSKDMEKSMEKEDAVELS